MGSLRRSILRKQKLKQAKIAKANLKECLRINKDMPSICASCDRSYDKTEADAMDKWHIELDPAAKTMSLYCSECWEMSNSA